MRSHQKRDRGYRKIVSQSQGHARKRWILSSSQLHAGECHLSIHTCHCVIESIRYTQSVHLFGVPVYLRLASSLIEIESMATNANGELVADEATVTGGGT